MENGELWQHGVLKKFFSFNYKDGRKQYRILHCYAGLEPASRYGKLNFNS